LYKLFNCPLQSLVVGRYRRNIGICFQHHEDTADSDTLS
jgi:hypothetical protein